jgi:hypothetical protein
MYPERSCFLTSSFTPACGGGLGEWPTGRATSNCAFCHEELEAFLDSTVSMRGFRKAWSVINVALVVEGGLSHSIVPPSPSASTSG